MKRLILLVDHPFRFWLFRAVLPLLLAGLCLAVLNTGKRKEVI